MRVYGVKVRRKVANPSILAMKEGIQRHERRLPIVMEAQDKKHRDYWNDQVFFTGGYGYGTHLVEIAIDSEGKRSYEARTINLGKEEDILSVLNGAAISDKFTPAQREVLTKIVENKEERYDRRDKAAIRTPRVLRTIPIRSIRSREKGVRRLKARERASLH